VAFEEGEWSVDARGDDNLVASREGKNACPCKTYPGSFTKVPRHRMSRLAHIRIPLSWETDYSVPRGLGSSVYRNVIERQ
jgi:hypothetical protein